jgi:hypothetical protein
MVILINRAAYVEVRDGSDTIFRRNKPTNHGGLTGRLLASLGIVTSGVYRVSFTTNTQVATSLIITLATLDGRKPNDNERADEIGFSLQTWDKEVTKVM